MNILQPLLALGIMTLIAIFTFTTMILVYWVKDKIDQSKLNK